jgi:hypothetical protein
VRCALWLDEKKRKKVDDFPSFASTSVLPENVGIFTLSLGSVDFGSLSQQEEKTFRSSVEFSGGG